MKKFALTVFAVVMSFLLSFSAKAQTIPYDPHLPNSEDQQADLPQLSGPQETAKKLPPLSAYAGTYVGVVVYYDVDTGVGDWEVVFDPSGAIRLSAKFQAKYPEARVSGSFTADGNFHYTNRETNGVTFTTTGKLDLTLKRFTATFTSNSAGTGALVCHKL